MTTTEEKRGPCFRICGDYLTEQARTFIVEDKPGLAWELLAEGLPGITVEQVADILAGKLKLVGENEFELVSDDPTKSGAEMLGRLMRDYQDAIRFRRALERHRDLAGLCHAAYYPATGMGGKKNGSPAGLLDEATIRGLINDDAFPRVLMKVFPKFTTEEWEKFWDSPRAKDVREVGRGLARFTGSGARICFSA